MATSSSFAVYSEQGVWRPPAISSHVNPPVTHHWVPLPLALQVRAGSSQFCRPMKNCGIPSKGVTQSLLMSWVCCTIVLCQCPWPQFTPFLLDLSVHLLPVQALVLCTNGSHIGFAVSRESLETQNQEDVLGSLWAPCHLLAFANLVRSILMIFFCPCYALCP